MARHVLKSAMGQLPDDESIRQTLVFIRSWVDKVLDETIPDDDPTMGGDSPLDALHPSDDLPTEVPDTAPDGGSGQSSPPVAVT